MGKDEEQKSLLLALKESDDPYGEMAREKICHQLYIEDPVCGGVLFGELVVDEELEGRLVVDEELEGRLVQ